MLLLTVRLFGDLKYLTTFVVIGLYWSNLMQFCAIFSVIFYVCVRVKTSHWGCHMVTPLVLYTCVTGDVNRR